MGLEIEHEDENAYQSLAASSPEGDARWAFGTGFDDPMAGVDTTVPSGVDAGELAAYCVMLGDDALVLSQRLSEWVTNAPELEDEVALANIGLDLLGQARLLLSRAGEADPAVLPPSSQAAEDALAYFRDEPGFRNVRLAELVNGDFAESTARLLVFATWRLALLGRLADSRDPVLAAIAAKGVKEVTYHRDYAARWAVRLGDGTAESHRRMQAGMDRIWPYLDELFVTHPVEKSLAGQGIAVDPATVRSEVDDVLDQVLAAATLTRPEVGALMPVGGRSGRDGVHTEAMGYLLAEFQSVARAHPDATW